MADMNIELAVSLGRMEREMAKAEARLVRLGNATEKKVSAALSGIDKNSAKSAASLDNVSKAMNRTGGVSKQTTAQLQNLGFQVGDFAVQVGGGTSALRALGQQLPQALGGFGVFGAAAGAAAAILIPLAAAMFKTGEEVKDLDEQLDDLAKTTDAMTKAVKEAAPSIEELRDLYGEWADEISRANIGLAAVATRVAQRDTVDAANRFGAELGVEGMPNLRLLGTDNPAFAKQRALIEAQAIERMKDVTGATPAQAALLVDAIARLSGAKDFDQVLNGATDFMEVLGQIAPTTDAQIDLLGRWGSTVGKIYDSAKSQVEAFTDSAGKATDAIGLIKKFEGFRSTPYDDGRRDGNGKRVGPAVWRAGFGSDTVTLADGSIQKVTQGMRVSLEDANRDLARRIGEFQEGIISRIGQERWGEFNSEQQAVLTSIAYNYGSLPNRIMEAVRAGTSADIANAIGGLAGDNGGINSKRRLAEAAAFGDSSVAAGQWEATTEAEKERQRILEKQRAERQKHLDQVKEYSKTLSIDLVSEEKRAELERQRAEAAAAINASNMSEGDKAAAIAAANGEMQKQLTIMALMEEANRRGVDLNAQMVNSTMTYAQAIEALGEAKKRQIITDQQVTASAANAAEAQKFWNDQQRALEDGLVDAIVAGESFADVLASVAQALAKAALQAALFGSGPLGGGGNGLLGGMFDGIFGGFRAAGGPVAAGQAYVVGERGPEIIVPRSAGQVIPNHALKGGGGGIANININLAGANGDRAIAEIARASVIQGLAEYDSTLPERVQQVNRDPRGR